MRALCFASVFAATALPLSALAFTFAPGDLLIGRSGQIDWRDASGTPIQSIPTQRPTGMRTHPITGQLWVTDFSAIVRVFDTQGNLAATYSTPGLTDSESIAFDSTGNAYIGGADVFSATDARVIKLSPSGVLLQTFTVPREDRGADWIDLCADDHTLYYTSEGLKIKRFDLSTNTPLPDFADITGFVNPSGQPTQLFAIRALPNGNVLAAGINDLYLFGPNGQVIRNYITPLNCFFSLAITPSGQEFWVQGCGPGAIMYKFNISTGVLVTSFSLGSVLGDTAGIAIVGDAARGSCITASIPTVSEWGLVALAVFTVAGGLVILRVRSAVP